MYSEHLERRLADNGSLVNIYCINAFLFIYFSQQALVLGNSCDSEELDASPPAPGRGSGAVFGGAVECARGGPAEQKEDAPDQQLQPGALPAVPAAVL